MILGRCFSVLRAAEGEATGLDRAREERGVCSHHNSEEEEEEEEEEEVLGTEEIAAFVLTIFRGIISQMNSATILGTYASGRVWSRTTIYFHTFSL